jgi:transposase InsO family protein
VGNILRHQGRSGSQRSPTSSWKGFISAHMDVLAGTDFFTVEVLKWRGLVTDYALFFLHLETRRITIAGITWHPGREWMEQIARTATQESWGYLNRCRYVLHDRDKKFCASFRSALAAAGVKPIMLPAKSPNLNAYAERWVRSVKQECLSKLVLFGEGPLQRSLTQFAAHYHLERNHQGKDNRLLTPLAVSKGRKIHCRQRLGGLLKFYARAA